jgi:hypothetical protein
MKLKLAYTMIAFLPLLAGCFPSYNDIAANCQTQFNPATQAELYMHCVDGSMADVQGRRARLSQALAHVGDGFQRKTTECQSTVSGNYVQTECSGR